MLRSWDYSSCLKDGTIRMSLPQDLRVAKWKMSTHWQYGAKIRHVLNMIAIIAGCLLGSALSQLLQSIFLYLEALSGRNLSLGALEHGNSPALSTGNAEARSASQWSLAQASKIQLGPIHSHTAATARAPSELQVVTTKPQ